MWVVGLFCSGVALGVVLMYGIAECRARRIRQSYLQHYLDLIPPLQADSVQDNTIEGRS